MCEISSGGTGGGAPATVTVGRLIGWLRMFDERLPVVISGPPESALIAMEVRSVSYLPSDGSLVGRGECLVLRTADLADF